MLFSYFLFHFFTFNIVVLLFYLFFKKTQYLRRYLLYTETNGLDNPEEAIDALKEHIHNQVLTHRYIKNCQRSFEFLHIKNDDSKKIREILKLREEDKVPEIFIFDDGEIHCNNRIYTAKNSKFQYSTNVNFIVNFKDLTNVKLFQKREPVNFTQIKLVDGHYSFGYGLHKTQIHPGDWLVIENKAVTFIDYNIAKNADLYALKCDEKGVVISDQKILPKALFEHNAFIEAAKWWSEYLPGVKDVSFDEVNVNTKLKPTMPFLAMHHMLKKQKAVTPEQLQKFITICAEKMSKKTVQGYDDLKYIQIGHASFYEPDDILEEALKEAEIKISGFGLFPGKTEMKIYSNGQITVNKKVICTDTNIPCFSLDNVNFTNAPYMKLKGDNFRLLEIQVKDLKGKLYDTYRAIDLDNHFKSWGDETAKKVETIYLTLHKRNFRLEHEFISLSDEELINILQDPNKIKSNFKASIFINYEDSKEKALKPSSYFTIGDYVIEAFAEKNYYRKVTPLLRVVRCEKDGTIFNGYSLEKVKKGEFLLFNIKDGKLNYFPSNQTEFAAFICDPQGTIISDKRFLPGDDLPILDKAVAAKMVIFKSGKSISAEIARPVIEKLQKMLDDCNKSEVQLGYMLAFHDLYAKIMGTETEHNDFDYSSRLLEQYGLCDDKKLVPTEVIEIVKAGALKFSKDFDPKTEIGVSVENPFAKELAI